MSEAITEKRLNELEDLAREVVDGPIVTESLVMMDPVGAASANVRRFYSEQILVLVAEVRRLKGEM